MLSTARSRRSSWTLWPNRAFHGSSSRPLASPLPRRIIGKRLRCLQRASSDMPYGTQVLRVRRNLDGRTKMLKEINHEGGTQQAALETISAHKEGGVLFASIAAPPMNLLGPELVRDLVSLIQQTEADDSIHVLVFQSADPDYFISHVDVTRIAEYGELATKLSGEASLAMLFRYLSTSRLVT